MKGGTYMTYLEILATIIIPVLVTLIASSGFWIYLDKRTQRNHNHRQLVIGLAHDRIIYITTNMIIL